MNQLSDEIVNKGIAKYMGTQVSECGTHIIGGRVSSVIDPSAYYMEKLYTESLDTLLSVWEKMEKFGINLRFDNPVDQYSGTSHYYLIDGYSDEYFRKMPEGNLTVKQKAAYATYLALQELR